LPNLILVADLLLDETAAEGDRESAVVSTALSLWAQEPNLPPLQVLDRAMLRHAGEDLEFQFDGEFELAPPHPFAELIRRAFAPDLDPRLLVLAIDSSLPELESLSAEWHRAVMRFADRYNLWRP
jgi:hypothetical protein